MLHPECLNCERSKVIHLTQIIKGEVKQLDLCGSCPHADILNHPAGFDLLGGLLPSARETQPDPVLPGQTVCPQCGCSETNFKHSGRFGCPTCYSVFLGMIGPVLSDMHRGIRHRGKWPKKALDVAQSP